MAETRAFVYLIFVANQNMEKEDDSQPGLIYNFDQALVWVKANVSNSFGLSSITHSILSGINEFATEFCTTKRIIAFVALLLNGYDNVQCHWQVAFLRYLRQYRVSCLWGVQIIID